MMDIRTSRTKAYQHLFEETLVSSDYLEDTHRVAIDDNSISYIDQEAIDTLNQLAWKTMSELIVEAATPIQKQVFELMAQGLTRIEIFKKVFPNQSKSNNSTVSQTIFGIQQLRKGQKYQHKGELRGGLKLKIINSCTRNEKYRSIIKQLDGYETGYMRAATITFFNNRKEYYDWLNHPIHPTLNIRLDVIEKVLQFILNNTTKLHPPNPHKVNEHLQPIKLKGIEVKAIYYFYLPKLKEKYKNLGK